MLKVLIAEDDVTIANTIEETLALEPPPGQLGEEAFDGVEPTGRGGREVKGPPGMAGQPGPDLGVLMRGVDDGMEGSSIRKAPPG